MSSIQYADTKVHPLKLGTSQLQWTQKWTRGVPLHYATVRLERMGHILSSNCLDQDFVIRMAVHTCPKGFQLEQGRTCPTKRLYCWACGSESIKFRSIDLVPKPHRTRSSQHHARAMLFHGKHMCTLSIQIRMYRPAGKVSPMTFQSISNLRVSVYHKLGHQGLRVENLLQNQVRSKAVNWFRMTDASP